ncbi:hypothetical protein JTE90_009917 [Oedothorax gibbosus]|uniref:Uncharacterized protein n=1 Tax=Oedothorax gibbosus TaxID=931172 RepID=A0AAV6UW46_9ARAC|nr:hypothetical protein JTE90_009917 [Oedothorax gibbosus]
MTIDEPKEQNRPKRTQSAPRAPSSNGIDLAPVERPAWKTPDDMSRTDDAKIHSGKGFTALENFLNLTKNDVLRTNWGKMGSGRRNPLDLQML